MHITVNWPHVTVYKHLNFFCQFGEERKVKEEKGRAWERGEEKGDRQGLGAKSHELQPVGDKTDGICSTTLQHPVHSKPQLQS